MTLSATRLRADLYRVLDDVARTGKPVSIERNGTVLRIVRAPRLRRRKRRTVTLKNRRGVLVGDPDALIHIDWSRHWKSSLP